MWKCLGLVAVVAVGCGRKAPRDAYAVGAYVGPNSLAPSSDCTYDMDPASAAKLDAEKKVGMLVAPGKLKVTCKGGVTEWDVLAPTAAKIHRIDGDTPAVKAGEKGMFRATPFAGDRELTTDGDFTVTWTPGADCATTATTEVDMPAGADSLKGSYTIEVTGKATGTCTLNAAVLGVKATQAVKIQ